MFNFPDKNHQLDFENAFKEKYNSGLPIISELPHDYIFQDKELGHDTMNNYNPHTLGEPMPGFMSLAANMESFTTGQPPIFSRLNGKFTYRNSFDFYEKEVFDIEGPA